MATTRSFLLIPVTLCFLIVLAAAADQQGTFLVIQGKALCKSNTSRIISNAPVQLVINNATVPGGLGRTTSDGHILMTVHLNSTSEQLLAGLMSNGSSKAFIVAPSHACGAPSLPAGTLVAAELQPMPMMTICNRDAGSTAQRPTIAAADTLLSHIIFAAVDKLACRQLPAAIASVIADIISVNI